MPSLWPTPAYARIKKQILTILWRSVFEFTIGCNACPDKNSVTRIVFFFTLGNKDCRIFTIWSLKSLKFSRIIFEVIRDRYFKFHHWNNYFITFLNYFIQTLKYLPSKWARIRFSLKQLSRTEEMRNLESQSKWFKRIFLKRLAAFTSHKRVDRFPKVCSKIWPVRRDPYGHSTSSCSCSKKWHGPARLKFILVAKETNHVDLFVKTECLWKKKKRKKQRKILRKLGEGEKRMNHGFPTYKLSLFANVRIENCLSS